MSSTRQAPPVAIRSLRAPAGFLALAGACYVAWGLWAPATPLILSADGAPRLSLQWPVEYQLLAPVTRLLDELTLLDDRQHMAIAWTLVAIVLQVAIRTALYTRCWVRRLRATVRTALVACGAGLAVYVTGALVPRPMAALAAADPDVILVDFHSHTERSHDGRWRFTAESNRAWHSASGFDAAYVTDHQTMRGWQPLAALGRLSPSGSGLREAAIVGGSGRQATTTLLPGIETVVPGAHLNLLGVDATHLPMFTHRRDLDTTVFASYPSAARPFTLLTLPFNVERALHRPPRLDAIELATGAPKGRRFAREHRARIIQMADSLGVALVASSNLHGWGSTAAAWTAVRLPGWRALEPHALDEAIRQALGTRPRDAWVAERVGLAPARSWLGHAMTLPRLAWHAAAMATPPERLAIVGWGLVGLLVVQRRARRT